MNRFKALVAATLVTALIACGMLAVGMSAIRDRPLVAAASAAENTSAISGGNESGAHVQQLQNLVQQYQAREKQYQSQLQDLNQQLDQANQQLDGANAQVSQYEQLLQALQARGVIQITADGRIRVRGN